MTKAHEPVIGVLGHYGNRNLGDESITAAALYQLRKKCPNAKLHCFSFRPNDTAIRHSVESFPIRYSENYQRPVLPTEVEKASDVPWLETQSDGSNSVSEDAHQHRSLASKLKSVPGIGLLVRIAARARDVLVGIRNTQIHTSAAIDYLEPFDLLIVAGSNQFLDNFGGPWGNPLTLMRWSRIAARTRTRLAFASVGANPLEHPLSRLFVRRAIKRADYLSYRDAPSRRLVEGNRNKYKGSVYPDLAFGLNLPQRASIVPEKVKTIAINPMPVYDRRYWYEVDDTEYARYVSKLAALAETVISSGYELILFGTMWRDNAVIDDVVGQLSDQAKSHLFGSNGIRRPEQVNELLEVLMDADVVVATRFHAVVLSLLVTRPVVGINYYRKAGDLLNEVGLNAYHEPLEACTVESIWQKVKEIESDYQKIVSSLQVKVQAYRNQIDEQWDAVLGLIR